MKTNEEYGKFNGRGEVRLVRTLPGPIERVWAFLTDADKRARWFGGGVTEPKAGGKAEFVMRHANLAPNETPPEKYQHVQDPGVSFEGRVLRYEPPRLLSYTFGGDDSVVTFELSAQGGEVVLVLTHRSTGDDIPELPNYGAGWHSHLMLLRAALEDKPFPPFWATHAQLVSHYTKAHQEQA